MLVITLKMMSIPAPPLFIEEVARSVGGVIVISINSLPPSGYSLYKQRES